MLYPKKINAKKRKNIVKIAILISFIIAAILIIINQLTTPNIPWAYLCVGCIIYGWIVTIYSMNRNTNLAGQVFLQAIAVSILMVVIDFLFGRKLWSIGIGIPIVIISANVIMLILTIIYRKNFLKYVIFQLLTCLFSATPAIFMTKHMIENNTLSIIALGISGFNLIFCFILCWKDIVLELKRKLHF